MPDNFPKILGGQTSARPTTSGTSLPPSGSVVMATVEENHGEGTYTLRWAGNRVTVSSRTPLNQGEMLILKSEVSPEGKPILVVQGPALPSVQESIIRNQYRPTYQKPNGEGKPAGIAAASQPVRSGGVEPGTTLLPLLEELPSAEEQALKLLAAAEEELEQAAAERDKAESSAAAKEGGGDKKAAGAAGSEAGKNARPAADQQNAAQSAPPEKGPAAPAAEGAGRPAATTENASAARPATGEPGLQESPQPRPPVQAETPGRTTTPDAPAANQARPAPEQPGATPGQDQSRPAVQPETPQGTTAPDAPAANQTRPAPEQPGATPGQDQSRPAVQPETPQGTTAPDAPAANQARPAPDHIVAIPGQDPVRPEARPAVDAAATEAARPEARPTPLPEQAVANRPAENLPPAGPGASGAAAPPDQPVGGLSGAALADALEQIAKVSTLPLGGGLDRLDQGRMGAVPAAIADKAAAILLNAAGLTPGAATLEAAKALMRYNVPIDRQIIQTLLALTAGAEEGDRTALLQAAARLAADEVPMAAPLAGGLADIIARKASIGLLLDKTIDLLNPEAAPPESRPLVDTASKLLQILTVDLDRADAALSLERFVSTLGREALGKAMALVENAAQVQLENHPVLPKIDQALAAIIGLLEEGAEATPGPGTGTGAAAAPAPGAASGETAGQGQPVPTPGAGPAIPPGAPTTGEQIAPQPPTPGIPAPPPAGGQVAAQPQGPGTPAQTGQPPPTPTPTAPPAAPAGQGPVPAAPGSPQAVPLEMAEGTTADQARFQPLDRAEAAAPGPGNRQAAEIAGEAAKAVVDQAASSVLDKLKSIFQLPGVNEPEIELLRPAGVLDRFLASETQPKGAADRGEVERMLSDLLSGDREKADAALRDLPGKSRAQLREMATRLNEMEQRILKNDPVVSRLADAANSLRDLGRQLLAVKAENLAGMEREPGVMLAEVPFKLNDQGGDGRMQMFYRRSKGQKGSWTARVILDLNTTNMGPVLGDMRFFGQDMVLNLFVDNAETAEYLARAADDLGEALLGKGFRLKAKFLVLPPPPAPPTLPTPDGMQIRSESEPAAAEPRLAAPPRRRGRLDTKA